jgi:hypothetical protein
MESGVSVIGRMISLKLAGGDVVTGKVEGKADGLIFFEGGKPEEVEEIAVMDWWFVDGTKKPVRKSSKKRKAKS